MLALAGPAIADRLPLTTVTAWAVAAVLWQSPPWLGAFWAIWSLAVGLRGRFLWAPAVFAALGLWLAGQPLSLLHPETAGPGLAVLATNVNAFSPLDSDADRAALEAQLAAYGADVVLVLEKRPLALPGYVRVADNFDADLPRASHATALFCRDGLRCKAAVTAEFGSDTAQMPVGLVRVTGAAGPALCIGALHAPPPVPIDPTGHLPHVRAIADRVQAGRLRDAWGPCVAGDPVVLAGDLNAVPRSPAWRALEAAGLRDALQGAGLFAASWPGGGGWPNLPYFQLDHVLAGPATVSGVRQHTVPGADHRALSFRVEPGPASSSAAAR